jgi:two-component system chemotaxis response regulator CheB
MKDGAKRKVRAVVMGASSGGQAAVSKILSGLPETFSFSIMVVIHRGHEAGDYMERSLNEKCRCRVKQADDKEVMEAGTVYFAPPDYHLQVEDDGALSLSADPPVNYSRPSVDVLFESAADYFEAELVGIVLTGANNDGSRGLRRIGEVGGMTVAQEPASAEWPNMPRSAIETARPIHILPLEKISRFVQDLCVMR